MGFPEREVVAARSQFDVTGLEQRGQLREAGTRGLTTRS